MYRLIEEGITMEKRALGKSGLKDENSYGREGK
jgi:hypothetical protein